nr:hypothetical protein [Kibdelosporangium sp. MJ126-NF4]
MVVGLTAVGWRYSAVSLAGSVTWASYAGARQRSRKRCA